MCGKEVSAGVGIVQPSTLPEFAVHFWMYGKVCPGASVAVAYTNDGYFRDAYS
jgi:hypothetical protein